MSARQSGSSATETPDRPGGRLRPVLTGVAGVAVLVALVGGVWLFASDDDPAPEPPPVPAEPEPADGEAEAEPEADEEVDEDAEAAPTAEEPVSPFLSFPELGAPWTVVYEGSFFRYGITYTYDTELDVDAGGSWTAVIATGVVEPQWYDAENLALSAESIAAWLATDLFAADPDLTRTTLAADADTIGERPAHVLRQEFAYSVDGLEATSSQVTVVIVDVEEGNGWVFVSAIPNTHPDLQDDAEAALAALEVGRVEEAEEDENEDDTGGQGETGRQGGTGEQGEEGT